MHKQQQRKGILFMIKKVSGSWFEFQHHNIPEGKYWNPVCRSFSSGQWRAKIREMKSLDMKYIVLLCTSLRSPIRFALISSEYVGQYLPVEL